MEFYFGSGTKINVNTEGVEKVKTLRALISDEIGKPTRRIELLAHNGDKLLDSTSLTDLDPQMPVTVFILPPAEPGTLLLTLEDHISFVSFAVFSADGARVLTGSWDCARIYDTNTGELQRTLQGHEDFVHAAVCSADGARVLTASCHSTTAKIWDANCGTLLFTLADLVFVTFAVFSIDGGRVLIGSRNGTATIWDVNTGELQATIEHLGEVCSAIVSADGVRLLTLPPYGRDTLGSEVSLWDAKTSTRPNLLALRLGVSFAVLSTDGTRVLFVHRLTAEICDITTLDFNIPVGEVEITFEEHASVVTSGAFSADNARVITGCRNGTAEIWDASTGTLQITLQGHVNAVMSAVFSADGARALTASCDKTAKVWQAALSED